MKAKVLVFALVLALVAVAGFANGGKEAATTTTTTTAGAGTPVYGGTLTMLHLFNTSSNEPPDWDPVKAAGPQVITYSVPIMGQAIEGDIEKYGPRGDKTYGFTNIGWVDESFYTGDLVESWEWTDPLTLTFHVRHGIMYSGISVNPGVMKPREFVADDFVYHLKRMKTSANKGQLWDWVADTSAPDKYTWVVKFKQYYADWTWWLASAFVQPYAKEVVEAPGGASDWKNLVGTGPFTIAEYVRGDHTTYLKNPNYSRTVTINGKEYKTPFIDKMVWPMITDEATQIASLRTGKVDWDTTVSPRYADTLTSRLRRRAQRPRLFLGSPGNSGNGVGGGTAGRPRAHPAAGLHPDRQRQSAAAHGQAPRRLALFQRGARRTGVAAQTGDGRRRVCRWFPGRGAGCAFEGQAGTAAPDQGRLGANRHGRPNMKQNADFVRPKALDGIGIMHYCAYDEITQNR